MVYSWTICTSRLEQILGAAMIKVEKRLPFGFRGDWGRVYKLYVFDEQKENIKYQNNNYVQIESDVQFKYLHNSVNKNISIAQPKNNMPIGAENIIVETTDAYFNDRNKSFECVVYQGDIVFLFGQFWLVEKVEEKNIYTPNKQSFYYCELKKILDGVVRRDYAES